MQMMKNLGGFLLIDARNIFNEGNRKQMLYTARFLWPSGARFLFNMYGHHAVLVMRGDKKGPPSSFTVKKVLHRDVLLRCWDMAY